MSGSGPHGRIVASDVEAAIASGGGRGAAMATGASADQVKALYQGNVAELVKYVKNPVKKRSGFAEMPKQDYLGDEVLNEVAKYILNDLKN